MTRNKGSLRTAIAAPLLALSFMVGQVPAQTSASVTPVAQQAVVQSSVGNPFPPLPTASFISAAEQYNILHAYNTGPRVRLTFDDCATAGKLRGILDFLWYYGIQAIFFFTGQCMLVHPGYRQQLLSAGQLLGNHSFDHTSYAALTAAQIYSEVRRYGSVIPTTVPKLCRPPYGDGAFSIGVYNALARAGCRPVFWTVDTRDWDGSPAATIVNRVRFGDATTPPAYPGGVILMHGTGLNTYQALWGVRSALIYRGLATFHFR